MNKRLFQLNDTDGPAPHRPGVYRVLDMVSGRCYIGSTQNLHMRKLQHHGTLRRGVHPVKKMQHDWDESDQVAFPSSVRVNNTGG